MKLELEGDDERGRRSLFENKNSELNWSRSMGVRPGVAMDSLKFHPGPSYPSTPSRPFQRWPAYRAGSLWPSSTPLDTPRLTPMFKLEQKQNQEMRRV
jgi:hypothetical protein